MTTIANKRLLLHVPVTVNIFLYQNCYYAAFIWAGFIILHCEIALQCMTTARRTYIYVCVYMYIHIYTYIYLKIYWVIVYK